MMHLDHGLRDRLAEVISHGLVAGMGKPERGALCVESAVCFALGEPHGDAPSCVAEADRAYAIALNDLPWPSFTARAEALLPLALAQLGTEGSDRSDWVSRVLDGTSRRILPLALRAVSRLHPVAEQRDALELAAVRCEAEGRTAVADAGRVVHIARAAAAGVGSAACIFAGQDASSCAGILARSAHKRPGTDVGTDAACAAADASYAVAREARAAAVSGLKGVSAELKSAHLLASAARASVLRLAVEIALDAYRAEGRA